MKTLLFILLFLAIGCLLIIENNNLHIFDEDTSIFSEKATLWAKETFTNVRTTTGNAIHVDWLP